MADQCVHTGAGVEKKGVKTKDREWRLPLCPHRPRSLPSDPGRPTRARWRFGEPTCHPLTGAGRLHASGEPQPGAHADAHAHPGRTHMHTILHTALPHMCTREQQQRLRNSSSDDSSGSGDDGDDNDNGIRHSLQ